MCKGPEEGEVKAQRGWSRVSRGWCWEHGGSHPRGGLALSEMGAIGAFRESSRARLCHGKARSHLDIGSHPILTVALRTLWVAR